MSNTWGYLVQDQNLNAQRAEVLNYAAEKLSGFTWGPAGHPARDGFWVEGGAHSDVPLCNRPAGRALDGVCERGDIVLVAELKQFQDVSDFLETVRIWQTRGVHVHVLDLQIDTSDPTFNHAKFGMEVGTWLDHARRVERKHAVNAARRRQGLALSGKVPYGFKLVGRRGRRRLEPDPDQRVLGRKFVEWFRAGHTFSDIFFHLLKERVRRPGNREWSRAAIHRAYEAELRLQAQEAREAQAPLAPLAPLAGAVP